MHCHKSITDTPWTLLRLQRGLLVPETTKMTFREILVVVCAWLGELVYDESPNVSKRSAASVKWILCSDWLPERARWAYLARSGLPALVPQKRKSFGVIFWPLNKSFIDQACSVKMAHSFLRFFVSVHKNAKKNLANIQPS